MSTIVPFRAVRFNQETVRLSDVVTQPYDKIDRAMQDSYYEKSPFNLARIIKSREVEEKGDPGYELAGQLWRRWLQDGVLTREREPGYFLYRQRFSLEGKDYTRHALVGLLDLGAAPRVLAHERTLAGPRADRLKLIRQTESNDGLIFLLHNGNVSFLRSLERLPQGHTPLETVTDEHGTVHEIFFAGRDSIREEAFDGADLIIADGHHRFAVAMQYKRECEELGWTPAGVESFDKRMVAVVEMQDPGLVILPTHRVVFGLPQPGAWDGTMSETFSRIETANLTATLETLRARGTGSLGAYHAGRFSVWTRKLQPEAHELDVSILHREVLGSVLGISEQDVASESRVRYFRSPSEAVANVDAGGGQIAFFLNPTRAEQVEACARRGEVMPQKSTDFFPKMLSGLLFMKMEIDKSGSAAGGTAGNRS